MATQKTLLTADDLLRLAKDHMRHELVRGELRTMPPAGFEHGLIAGEALRLVGNHAEASRLGHVFAAETGFRIGRDPDTVRAADVAFLASGRFPPGELPKSFAELAPDLVIEVVSPSDTAKEVEEKVHDWLEAGVRLLWLVYPSTRSVTVYRSLADVKVLKEADRLDGGDVLPGFSCAVRELFPS